MIIYNATIVNEGERFQGALQVTDGLITAIFHQGDTLPSDPDTIDAQGCFLLPGVIDDHVHMREPGLTHKANMQSETRAAAAGGVTTVLDMPNVLPQTTTLPLLRERYIMAQGKCHVNYGFYLGATAHNLSDIRQAHLPIPLPCGQSVRTPGVKLFMGSSTGGMLVDKENELLPIFAQCPTLLMTHCEDTDRINRRMADFQALYGDDPDVVHHPHIRDTEACLHSTTLAVHLAQQTGCRLHVAHLTTEQELSLFRPFDPQITAEACVAHLLYTHDDYPRLGTRIKCNPAIKTPADRDALRRALTDGRITVVATDHAPHLLSEKQGGARRAVSGMPMLQFSLPSMLELVNQGILTIERLVQLMCHNPATLFHIHHRGFLRPGYHADLVLLRPHAPWQVTPSCIQSLCAWSPLEGDTLHWRVERTWVNGHLAWDGHQVTPVPHGQPIQIL